MNIQTLIIHLPLPFRMGQVNSYLIATEQGYILIDTGGTNSRKELVTKLENAGCKPGHLKLIILTHGDFDHIGNAAYLRDVFGGKIAMHADDSGMADRGDMFFNRKRPNLLIRILLPLFSGFIRSDRFSPDLFFEDGDDLSGYGIDAKVISIPGHSKGSIGILTTRGDLFCGDLLNNTVKPRLNDLIDDQEVAKASLQRLRNMRIVTVYPGHGGPFSMDLLKE